MSKQKRGVLIVDNELGPRVLIKDEIVDKYHDFEVVAETDNTEDALRMIQESKRIQGVFLDIHFDFEGLKEGLSAGFDLACKLNKLKTPPWIIFMTARPEAYSSEAHRPKYRPAFFLDKPPNEEKLKEIIEQIRIDYPLPIESILIEHKVDSDKKITEVRLDDILYIHTNKDSTIRVHLWCGEILEKNREILADWEKKLSPFGFHKISQSCIINLKHIQELTTVNPYLITLKTNPKRLSDKKLRVPPNYLRKLKAALKKFEGTAE